MAWQEARELFKRENWEAVVESFQQMELLEPGLKDPEGLLKTARRRLREREIQNQVDDSLRKATRYFESGEWTLALSDLARVLELDGSHEVALELQRRAQQEAAKVQAAETLAKDYGKALHAIDVRQWEKAVDLLNIVIRKDPAYKDARALLDRAAEELDETKAELKVSLSVKPSQAPPDSDVMWTLKIRNTGRVPILHIVATELRAGAPKGSPAKPFRLAPDESKAISIPGHVADRGERRHFEVVGATPAGRSIRHETKASVNVKKPQVPLPDDDDEPQESQTAADTSPVSPDDFHQVIASQIVLPEPVQFADSLQLAKDRVELSDRETRQLIELLAEGGRHYRFTIDPSLRTPNWPAAVDLWQQRTAELKLDRVVWISLGAPPLGRILDTMKKLAREIHRRIGVDIPLHEFEAAAAARR